MSGSDARGPEPPPGVAHSAPAVLEGASGNLKPGRASHALSTGMRLHEYEILDGIATGGMGAVYLASDLNLDRLVALKVLPTEQASDPETVARFEQEARSAARLDHDNIARVYALGFDRGQHFIAFEYVEGTTLRQRVEQQGPLEASEVVGISLQICHALAHASERGVVHRDIKPSNIILTPGGRAKLVDMGLARRFERGLGDDGLTQSGMTLGTFDYISPEQARDPRHVDVRSDLYSLGCTMYHMLTGRPPFGDGTVLQKLLQHQEEPAPDVRTLSPAVPSGLAAIILKLMEKDRQRRYERPELLAADLQKLAGSSPSGEVGLGAEMRTGPAAAWERHLVWALPALGLMLVVVFLILWSQNDQRPNDVRQPTAQVDASAKPASEPRTAPKEQAPPTAREATGAPVLKNAPRVVCVSARDDLVEAIERAPDRATVILSDAGPYMIRPRSAREDDTKRPRRVLTIQAQDRVRPVLRMERAALDRREPGAMLSFHGGRVHVEGLEFQLSSSEGAASALEANDVDLSLSRCTFRRAGPGRAGQPVRALDVRASSERLRGAGPGIPARLVACEFGESIEGIRARGPVELELRDCLFGPGRTAIRYENALADVESDATLGLRNVSIKAGGEPVIRVSRTRLRVLMQDSVVAAADNTQGATLLQADGASVVDWLGRENLYGRVACFLQPEESNRERARIRSFAAWSDGPGVIREMRSLSTDAEVWARRENSSAKGQRETYELAVFAPNVGARQGPSGSIPRLNTVLSDLLGSALSTSKQGRSAAPKVEDVIAGAKKSLLEAARTIESTERGPTTKGETGAIGSVANVSNSPSTRIVEEVEPAPPATLADTSTPMPMPMPVAPPLVENDTAAESGAPQANAETETSGTGTDALPAERSVTSAPPSTPAAAVRNPPAPRTVATLEDWRRSWTEQGSQGGTIRLAAGARLELPACVFPRDSRWLIEAEPGATRPLLTWSAAATSNKRDARAWMQLLSGAAVELRGIDLMVASGDDGLGPPIPCVFLQESGTDLVLSGCTVTYPGGSGLETSALLMVRGGGTGLALSPTTSARFENSFLRIGGDVIDVEAGRRFDGALINGVVASSGSFLKGHGRATGLSTEPIKLVVRQSSVRAAQGLARLASGAREPEVPSVDLSVRESILATTPEGDPLLRVEGQGGVEDLRDRVTWEGFGVVYHQIETYRRDDSSLSGTAPLGFKRLSWEVAVGPHEDASFHGDAQFERPWPSTREAWRSTLEDWRLAPTSPVPHAGARLERVPQPPASR